MGTPGWSPDRARIAISLGPRFSDRVVEIEADGSGPRSEVAFGRASSWWPAIDAPAEET